MAAAVVVTTAAPRPARLAQRCIERLQLAPPIDVLAVARACRVFVIDQPPGPEAPTADAYLAYHRATGRFAVFCNPSFRDPLRRRFSIAHELGHYLLHRQLITAAGTSIALDDPWLEAEAHQFAAELLMPDGHVAAFQQYMVTNLDVQRTYGVSMAAWYRRLADLGHAVHPRYR